jgi:hypothetical protein
VELMMRFAARRMDSELGRRQLEDQPARAVLDVVPLEDVAQHLPERVGLRCVQQHVSADDRHRAKAGDGGG